MQDLMCKLVSAIIGRRLTSVLTGNKERPGVGLEDQNGFMPGRGTTDGSFCVRTVLLKRREHRQHTWAVFVDLVKAFDSVPRDGLMRILAHFGIPPHLCSLILKLHTNNTLKMEVGGDDTIIRNTTSVKQGDVMAPILFLFVIQACLEAIGADNWPGSKLLFRTKQVGGQVSGMKWSAVGDLVEFWTSLYADDGAFFFDSREELIAGTQAMGTMMRRFGLEMHSGVGYCTDV
ncbi:uncharacterized protein METZ01_LOCUS432172, partial [marine metagenome]